MTETELVDAYACVGPLMATAYERSGHEVAGAYRSWTRQVNAEIETLVEEAAQEGYDFLESAGAQNQSMVRLNIVALVLGVAGGVLVGWLMSWRIVNPIVRITNTLHELSEGRSDVEPPRLERKDEIGALGRAIVRLQRHLTGTVEIARSIAEGDLSVAPQPLSERDVLGLALVRMLDNLREIVGTMQKVALIVASESAQLRSAARQVSDGASDQAGSVEQTSSSMEQMAAAIKQNALNAEETERAATRVAEEARKGVQSVLRTVHSMKDISDKIGVVEEITRKIDLLALNASVEAARAGSAKASPWSRPRSASSPRSASGRRPRSSICRPRARRSRMPPAGC